MSRSKSRLNIQVFTYGETTCEVDAELVSIDSTGEDYHIEILEEDDSKWTYYFPKWNVSMIRISEYEN